MGKKIDSYRSWLYLSFVYLRSCAIAHVYWRPFCICLMWSSSDLKGEQDWRLKNSRGPNSFWWFFDISFTQRFLIRVYWSNILNQRLHFMSCPNPNNIQWKDAQGSGGYWHLAWQNIKANYKEHESSKELPVIKLYLGGRSCLFFLATHISGPKFAIVVGGWSNTSYF